MEDHETMTESDHALECPCSPQNSCSLWRLVASRTAGAIPQRFSKGSAIYRQGSLAKGLFIVCRGSVALVAATARKKERIVGIVPAGEVFGLDCLFAGGVRTQSAVARQDSAACYITPCQLKNTLSTDVGLSWRILVSLAERVHALGEERLLFTGCRVPEQIVNLTRLCARHPDVAHLKQAELADWLGVSRETVCRELRSITTPKHASSRADEDWRN